MKKTKFISLEKTEPPISQPSELLPCPFCGSDGIITMVGSEYYPKCSENKKGIGYCYASRYPTKGEDGFRYEKDAIEVWNKRASQRAKD